MSGKTEATEKEAHWQKVYTTRGAQGVSWFTPQLERSLALIRRYASEPSGPIIDVGGGASTLADDLLAAGYTDITVLDIAESALRLSRQRMSAAADRIGWLRGDITNVPLPEGRFALWHDRAVFHFLVDGDDRRRYAQQLAHALHPGGHVVMAVFGPEGPKECSNLPTERYDAAGLNAALGPEFVLRESALETHTTPFATTQQFLYACLQYQG